MKFYSHKNTFNKYNLTPSRIEQGPDPNGKILILFYEEDKLHNAKNAAISLEDGKKGFFLRDELYFRNFYVEKNIFDLRDDIFQEKINKSYWRRFVKMQIFK
jgi:hypothetical protein